MAKSEKTLPAFLPLEKLLDIIGVMIIVIGRDQKVQFVNQKTCTILGYEIEEIIGQNWFDNFLPERIRSEIKNTFEKIISGQLQSSEYVENPVLTKSGEERLIAWHNTFLTDESGKIIAALSSGEDITERKKAEEALRQAEEKYRTILETIEEGYYEVDLAGNFTFANAALAQMAGYSKEELTGLNNRQYMDEETAKKVFKVFNQVYQTGEPAKWANWEITRKDGSRRIHEGSVSLMRNTQGEAIGFRGLVRDITEKKQAEQALREAEEQYRRLFEISTSAIIIRDQQGIIRLVNPAAMKMLQASKVEDVIGRPYLDFVHPEDRPGSLARIQLQTKAALGEQGTDPSQMAAPPREHRLVTIKGNTIYVESTGVAFSHKGEVWIQGIFQDITKRKQAEEALRESEEKYRNLFSYSLDAVYLSTKEGKFIDFNQATVDLFGYSPDELFNLNIRQLYANPEDRPRFQREIEQKGALKEYEVKFKRKDGTEIDCLLTATLRYDKNRNIIGYQGIIRDVTARKRMEEEREKLITELKDALNKIKTLSGLVPICASCKKIRDDKGYWNQLEIYIQEHTQAEFSHGLCPDCMKKLYPDIFPSFQEENK